MNDGGVGGAHRVACGASGSAGIAPTGPTTAKDDTTMVSNTEPGSRSARVHAAIRNWQSNLIDVSRRNPLLYFKDLSAATLDLATTTPEVLSSLVKGTPQRMADLIGDEQDERLTTEVARRLLAVYRKVTALNEERGIKAGYLALGMATWRDPGFRPAAPILLYPIDIVPTGSRLTDFRLEVDDDPAVNPVLLEYLAGHRGVDVHTGQFPIPTDANPDSLLSLVSRQLWRAANERVPGFSIQRRQVIGAFSYTKLPMVDDLREATRLLVDHDVIAAIAGDSAAQQSLRSAQDTEPYTRTPADEYLVLDADSSQSAAINAAATSSLVVKGPPGTGKSQTITNLIATLIADGQRVLFVAEKRAAIDVVLRRLAEVGLSDLVMDAHDGAKARHRIIDRLREALEQAGNTGKPKVKRLHDRLTIAGDTLTGYRELMFAPREPWGRSVFDAHCALLEPTDVSDVDVVLSDETLARLDPLTADSIRDRLREYADLGGFVLRPADTVWFDAHLGAPTETSEALEVVDGLVEALPSLIEATGRIATLTRTDRATTLAEYSRVIRLLAAVAETEKVFDELIWSAPLSDWIAATGGRRWRNDHGVSMSWLRRRKLRGRAQALAKVPIRPGELLHQRLSDAAEQLAQWHELTVDGQVPFAPETLAEEVELLQRVRHHTDRLAALFPEADVDAMPLPALTLWVKDLAADRTQVSLIGRLRQLRNRLTDDGLADVLTVIARHAGDADQALTIFERCFATSLIAQVAKTDDRFHRHRGEVLHAARENFVAADRAHLALNPKRVRRAAAEHLFAARDEHPLQETFLKKQLARRRRQAPLRTLFEQAEDVLTALTPCVVMSPLVVSQQLPARRMFDVVIFDEASQIRVPDAIPGIMRADRIVVAGDPLQLPPTAFFTSTEEEVEEDVDDLAVASGMESILESMDVLLPARTLTWHYRSRDEALIDFANRQIYDGRLITFAGRDPSGALRHIHCVDGDRGGTESANEVAQVVELVIEHAQNRPDRSLGVIAMGLRQANRIAAALDVARVDHPELDGFFDPDRDEPFFVKNLERVQGDERDDIVLSLGYATRTDGRPRHQFGPLNQEGGHRRLNVAITRAKRSMTVVSGFTADDLDPTKLTARGPQLLRDFLAYVESGGRKSTTESVDTLPLNAFERDVRDRLEAAEIPTIARYGAGRHRIDLAVTHPRDATKMVLAIEVDGVDTTGSLDIRDRDRLRRQVLTDLGWAVHRIWPPDWFADPEAEVLKARRAYNAAVIAAETVTSTTTPAAVTPKPRTEQQTNRAATKPESRSDCPITTGRKSIRNYSPGELVRLLQWIRNDQRLRTEDELLREAIRVLGFSRRGPRIVEALSKAIAATRSTV
ncbi:AAA domain-containing protein [Stackebrandtia endophytica]|uniref:AAA domain-containing protein n=1 Tax=Stackebrandtia endophytica TaxID=1496996 RepID=A0A543AR86_9ACTN|nr:AAA domain-containing protein [Stackebrandtia endophytica]TQL75046.1 AAA domain-containing protein [Stackebrandtia endophytica]